MIPCLPPNIASRLDNIFFVINYYSNDRKIFGNEALFNILIKELNDLSENGLEISTNHTKTRVFFKLALITGDNPGLHKICGFVNNLLNGRPCRVYAQPQLHQSKI